MYEVYSTPQFEAEYTYSGSDLGATWTPEKTLFDGMVKYVRLPGSGGLFGVYYNHAPLISPLDKGEVTYRHGETKEHVAIERGFVEVRNNTVAVCVTETKS